MTGRRWRRSRRRARRRGRGRGFEWVQLIQPRRRDGAKADAKAVEVSFDISRRGFDIRRMRIIRFVSGGQIYLGQSVDDKTALRIEGDLLGSFRVTDQRLAVEKLLAPIVPSDILCIGLNYREHAKESGGQIPE